MSSMTSTVHTEARHSTDGGLTATSTAACRIGTGAEWDTTATARHTISEVRGDMDITDGTTPRGTMSAATFI